MNVMPERSECILNSLGQDVVRGLTLIAVLVSEDAHNVCDRLLGFNQGSDARGTALKVGRPSITEENWWSSQWLNGTGEAGTQRQKQFAQGLSVVVVLAEDQHDLATPG
jgi:hypothetical protein